MAKKKKKKEKTGRTTVYNRITTPEKLSQVNHKNKELGNDFLEYLMSIDRAPSTIKQYRANLDVFWVWNLEYNDNKFFVDMKKREFSKFQNHCINVWHWSPKRVRVVKATLSSLSNFIENILDDEFEDFKPIVRKIESPADGTVREKSVFEEKELNAILETLVSEGDYIRACMLSLAMNSGRRKSELARFKVSYFDDENLICDGALYKTPEEVKTKGRGSRGKMLTIYTLAKDFKPYLDMWMEKRKELGIKSEWLFPMYDYKKQKWVLESPINVDTIDSWANVISARATKPFYWHSMRHYFTTKLAESNIPESVIVDIVGWSSSEMLKIYDDRTLDSQFDKYFGAEGIKKVEKGSLDDM